MGAGAFGELTRAHPRVTEDRGWRLPPNARVGASVAIRRADARDPNGVDVVINYWTGVSGQCTTWLAPAGVTFWAGAPAVQWVVTRALNDNAPERGLEFGPADSVRRHRALFTNLPHDTLYHYRTACRDWFPAVDSYFRTPPGIDSTRDVQFAVWSDIIKAQHFEHYYVYDDSNTFVGPGPKWKYRATPESWVAEALTNAANAGFVDFGLIAGDLSDQDEDREALGFPSGEDAGGSVAGYLYRYFSMYEPLLAGIPVFTQHGNHDVLSIWGTKNRDEDYFWMIDGPRGEGTDEGFGRQWFSFDSGQSHVLGLDVVKTEDSSQEKWRELWDAELSDWRPTNALHGWVHRDLGDHNSTTGVRWRFAFQHGAPSIWAGPGADGMCGEKHLDGYCWTMNQFDLAFLFLGHHGPDLLKHVGGERPVQDENDVLYSYQTQIGGGRFNALNYRSSREGYLHVRVRRDAIVVSRIWPGPYRDEGETNYQQSYKNNNANARRLFDSASPEYDAGRRPPFLRHPDGTPAMGALIECFKVVPGIRDEYLELLGCERHEYDECLQSLGCHAHDVPETASGATRVWQCDPDTIPAGYLKRQIVKIVARAQGSDYGSCSATPLSEGQPDPCVVVLASDLLHECTPCSHEVFGEDNAPLQRWPPVNIADPGNPLDDFVPPGQVRVISGMSTDCGTPHW